MPGSPYQYRRSSSPEDLSAPSSPKKSDQQRDLYRSNRKGKDDDVAGEEILPLSNIAPAIFVPCTFDLTTPPAPQPTDPTARLAQDLADLDAHAAAVKANISHLAQREATRIQRTCAAREVAARAGAHGRPPQPHGSSSSSSLTLAQQAEVVRSVSGADRGQPAQCEVEREFGARNVVLPNQAAWETLRPAERGTPRAYAQLEMLRLVRLAAYELDGYQGFVEGIKAGKQDKAAQEIVRRMGREGGGGGGGGQEMDVDG